MDFYAVLQVSESAATEVIEAAYRALARKHHPDVSRDQDAAQRMRELNEAYRVLHDPAARAAYDARRSPSRTTGGATAAREAPAAPLGAGDRPVDLLWAALADAWRRLGGPRAGRRHAGSRPAAGRTGSRAASLRLVVAAALVAAAAGALAAGGAASLRGQTSDARAVVAYGRTAAAARAAVEDSRQRFVPAATGGYAVAVANTAFGSLATQLIADLEHASAQLRRTTRVPPAAEDYHFLQLEDWRVEREIRVALRDAVVARNPDLWTQAAERELAWLTSPQHLKSESAAWHLAAFVAQNR